MEPFSYRECQDGRRFILHIPPGGNLVANLVSFAEHEKIGFAVMVSAIGSVRNVTFSDIQAGAHLPITEPRMPVHTVEGPLDLIGIEGNIAPGSGGRMVPHLHVFGSRSTGEVIGGHFIEAEVFATCEVVLAEYLVSGVERHRSEAGGIDTLFFEGEQP